MHACKLSEGDDSLEQSDPPRNKMWFILAQPGREFHPSVTEDANSVNGAWNCRLLLAWHSISPSRVYVLGSVLRGLLVWALPAPACIPIPFYAPLPLLPDLHKYNQACQPSLCILPPLFLIDYAVLLHQSQLLWIPQELAQHQGILPLPDCALHLL